jgi:hypothetical protein
MNRRELIEKEIKKRSKKIDILSYCFKQQRDFIEDPFPFKAAFTNRRAGKSTAIGTYIVHTALNNPNCNILYLGLSKETAMRSLWKDILQPILLHFNIKVNFTEKKITFSNGSTLFVQGTNANRKELAKVLGQKYLLALLDEAQSYDNIDTKELIYQSLAPTVQDMQGTICMTGTPTNAINTFFYKVTTQKETRAPGWKVHEWNTKDNNIIQADGLSQAQKYQIQIDNLKKDIPNIEETDEFQQQYLGKWIILNMSKVYRFDNSRNLIEDGSMLINLLKDKSWFFILGIDFGWTDASALCILAYHRQDPNVYIVHSEKHKHWDTTNLANRIHDLNKTYHFSQMVGDSAAAQSIATLARQHQLPVKAIDKPGKKRESIAIINADFITSRLKIDPSNNQELIQELNELIWDPKKLADGDYEELSKLDNHICDAMLYGYRASRHYRAQKEVKSLNISDQQDRIILMDKQDFVPKSLYDQNSIFQERDEDEIIHNFKQNRNKGTY